MVEKVRRRHKRSGRRDSGASNQITDLTSGKKPGIRTAGPNLQPHPLGALRTIALIGGFIAVDIHPRVHIAANEVNAYEPALRARRITAILAGQVIRQIKMFAGHRY
jgi:hypothetical protein